jgi:hypothetical protein
MKHIHFITPETSCIYHSFKRTDIFFQTETISNASVASTELIAIVDLGYYYYYYYYYYYSFQEVK